MPSRPGRQRFLALIVLGAALLAPLVPASEPPLTDEDVVRLVMQSSSEAKIIAIIETSEVDFDLSDEMVDEMLLAGVTPKILAAMRTRQRLVSAAAAADDSPDAPHPSVVAPAFRLVLNRSDAADDDKEVEEAPASIVMLNQVDTRLIESLQLRTPEPMLTDLAVVLLCRTPDHVPDHWRSQTPLGRDFVTTPRHRMLHFHSGATATPVSKARERLSKLAKVPGEWSAMPKLAILELEVPTEIVTELDLEIEHDLTLGIAMEIGGRFFLVTSDDKDAVVVHAGAPLELDATLRSRGKGARSLSVKFLESRPPAATEAEATSP